jgi:short-subunit dehydrogenase
MPGATETEFFERAEMEDTKVGAAEKDDPAEVARQGFDALMAGKERVVGGSRKNKAQVAASKVLPDSVKAEKHREMAEPGSAKED